MVCGKGKADLINDLLISMINDLLDKKRKKVPSFVSIKDIIVPPPLLLSNATLKVHDSDNNRGGYIEDMNKQDL
jgi:hypothetical protein